MKLTENQIYRIVDDAMDRVFDAVEGEANATLLDSAWARTRDSLSEDLTSALTGLEFAPQDFAPSLDPRVTA